MRLIDADKLNFSEQHYNKSQMKAILDFIDNQPTAYDVNKVLRQLDEEKKLSYANLDTCSELGPLQEPEDDDYFIIGFKKATKIVKAGGIR
jgi:hypothetical protein